MNVYDSERMGEALCSAGYRPVETPEAADMVILNTCHIREKAAEKVYSELGRLKKLKDGNAEMIIGVAGCVAQAEGEEMLARAPVVDLVFGPQTFQALPDMLRELADNRLQSMEMNGSVRNAAGVVRTSFPAEEKFAALLEAPRRPLARSPSAFVTVQEGCDKFCTFCVVPYTRGAEVSRACGDIEAEVRALSDRGVREITLLGQNVNAWCDRGENIGLGRLLRRLARQEGVKRLRYTTSHPRDMDDALIEAHADVPELMPYLHLPVQSGSDKILGAMNRKHTAREYLALVDRIRAARPDIALSSDFIVGFPGETEEDFAATLDLAREVQYAQAYSFKYSPRPGTPAADEDQLDEAVKSDRLARLQEVLNAQQSAFNAAQTGRTLAVLFEKPGKKPGQMAGRSPYLQTVHARADETVIGKTLPVRIEKAHANSLTGEILSQEEA